MGKSQIKNVIIFYSLGEKNDLNTFFMPQI